jgi:excisionase family DNA binding protein
MAAIKDLGTHPARYVTVGELAEYWGVSRQRVYKHIDQGSLPAVKLGPRCYRVLTSHAMEFERRISSTPTPLQPVRNGLRGVPTDLNNRRRS